MNAVREGTQSTSSWCLGSMLHGVNADLIGYVRYCDYEAASVAVRKPLHHIMIQ